MSEHGNFRLRILNLLKIFLEETDENHPITVPQIIRRMRQDYGIPIQRRAIYEDIEALRTFGMDILERRTRTYGYFLASRDFELPELKLLVDAVQASRFITTQKSRVLISKLEKLASVHQAKELHRQVFLADRLKAKNEQIYYNVDEIQRAIRDRMQISFQYSEYTLEKTLRLKRDGELYVVSPYLLIWDDAFYYLVAYHERYHTLSHFRVDKMSKISITADPCISLDSSVDPATYAQHVFGMFSGDRNTVTVAFDNSLIGPVIDRFGRDIRLRLDGNRFIANLPVTVSAAFYSWVFQFGEKAQILAPADVVEGMAQMLAHTMRQYSIDMPQP